LKEKKNDEDAKKRRRIGEGTRILSSWRRLKYTETREMVNASGSLMVFLLDRHLLISRLIDKHKVSVNGLFHDLVKQKGGMRGL
jgi:hypothetical protein